VPLWRGNHVAVRQLVGDFSRYLYLPRLRETAVLLQAIRDGLGLLPGAWIRSLTPTASTKPRDAAAVCAAGGSSMFPRTTSPASWFAIPPTEPPPRGQVFEPFYRASPPPETRRADRGGFTAVSLSIRPASAAMPGGGLPTRSSHISRGSSALGSKSRWKSGPRSRRALPRMSSAPSPRTAAPSNSPPTGSSRNRDATLRARGLARLPRDLRDRRASVSRAQRRAHKDRPTSRSRCCADRQR